MSNVPPPPYGDQPQQPPGQQPPPYGQQPPPPTYGQPVYGGGGGGGGGGTNPLAIVSLVASIVGICCGIGSIAGIICGFIARNQIQQSGGTQEGEGLALAGIIIGFVTLGLSIIFAITGNFNYYS